MRRPEKLGIHVRWTVLQHAPEWRILCETPSQVNRFKMTGLREVCLTVMVMVMLVHGAPSQPVGEKSTPTDNVAYYPYVRLPVDAENDPKLKDVIPGPIPVRSAP